MSERPPDERQFWLDKPANVNLIFKILVAVCVVLFLGDLAYHKHGHFPFEEWFGFHAFFGFGAYVLIVLTATQLRKVLKRDEDYYD